MRLKAIRMGGSAALLSVLLAAETPSAQAVVPAKGEASMAVLFTNALSTKHYLPAIALDRGHIDSNTVLVDFTYGLSDRLAISASLPFVATRYRGTNPHRLQSNQMVALDDGSWHTTTQDFRLGVRYNLIERAVIVTPFIGSVTPSNGYDFFAHASPGRATNELLAGMAVARVFAERGVFVQGRYGFGVGERVVGFRPRHSEGQIEVGYFLTPSVRLLGLVSGRYGHNGIDITTQSRATLPWDQYFNHDRIAREHGLSGGGGISVTVRDSVDVFASVVTTLTARNSHGMKYSLTSGVSWTFRQADAIRQRNSSTALARCLCQKGVK